MLFLIFESGDNRYSIRSGEIIEIIPLVNLLRLPRTPAYFPGLLNYRGNIVPVVDLGMLLDNAPHRQKMSTRIVLMQYRTTDIDLTVGLILDNIIGTMQRKDGMHGTVDLLPEQVCMESGGSEGNDRMITRFLPTRLIPRQVIEEILRHYMDDSADQPVL